MRRAGLLVVLLGFLPGAAGAQGIGIGVGIGNALAGKPSGRLVVACDMTSDTCSDGRRITTTRATPVPCEVSPGVWEMVPEDTGCYSVRGLEAWAATTSYVSYGAELDRSPWGRADGAMVQQLPHGYRVTGIDTTSRIFQTIPPDVGTWTFSCVADTGASIGARLRVYQEGGTGTRICNLDSDPGFKTHSCTTTVTGTPTQMVVHIHPGSGHVDVAGCWLTRTATPGRACWGGEAPVHCNADRHTISTDGWPTEAGEVSLVYTPGQAENAGRYLISASTFGIEGWEFYVRNDDTMSFIVHNDGTTIYSSAPLTWEPRPYALRVRWGDGIVSFWRDGVLVGTSTMTRLPNGVKSTALIGSRETMGEANGAISNLRIRGVR